MDLASELLTSLIETPLPTLLVLSGIVLLIMSVVSKLGGLIVVSPQRQTQALVSGAMLLLAGLALNAAIAPPDMRDEARQPSVDQNFGALSEGDEPASKDFADQRIFEIPRAQITIDGSLVDWRDLPVAYAVSAHANSSKLQITRLNRFYLARDDKFIYFMAIVANGPLSQVMEETGYFFQARQNSNAPDTPGDLDAFVVIREGHIVRVNTGIRHEEFLTQNYTPVHKFAAMGRNFIEWKVPRTAMSGIRGRYLRFYIHNFERNIIDEHMPEIRIVM